MNFIKSFFKGHLDDIRQSLAEENIKKVAACFRAGFFFILFAGTVVSPVATIFHTPPSLIWILSIIVGFTVSGLLTSSPVFSRNQIFKIANYMTAISSISMVVFFGMMLIFHIHIKPL